MRSCLKPVSEYRYCCIDLGQDNARHVLRLRLASVRCAPVLTQQFATNRSFDPHSQRLVTHHGPIITGT